MSGTTSPNHAPRYLLSYYGDDFTGSTDVMEALSLGGVQTVLFLEPPTPERLAAFPQARAVGVAGTSRAMTREQMDAQLPPVFAALKALNAEFCHYKVCSTFDSSPSLGSIGRALELGLQRFPQAFVPLVVGAPKLKRYVVFGHLFATADSVTYRLDRHPTMPKHPATPMSESDLRRHLAAQTDLASDLVDVLALESGMGLSAISASDADVIFFDTANERHLELVGALLWQLNREGVRFVAGSSGLEHALVAHLRQSGKVTPYQTPPKFGKVDAVVVMSGSAAPATAAQIDYAGRQGFELVRVDTAKVISPRYGGDEHRRLKTAACTALGRGRSVVLYTARGSDDPAVGETRRALRALGYAASDSSRLLGSAQGRLLREVLEVTGVRRACVAGGDTCGYAARELGLYALELRAPIAPGAPLCTAHTEGVLQGLELALKAGQVGEPDYFLNVRDGTTAQAS